MTKKKIVIAAAVAALFGGVYLFRFKRPAALDNTFARLHPTLDPYAEGDGLAGGIGITVSNDRGDTAYGESHWRDRP